MSKTISKAEQKKKQDKKLEQIKRSARLAVAQAVEPEEDDNLELNFAEEPEDFNESESHEFDAEPGESIQSIGSEVDIFDIGKFYAEKKNEPLKFMIYKNNELLVTKSWPYSYEQLQKDYGAGYYRIDAKSMTTNQYVKRQSKMIADSPNASTRTEIPEEISTDVPTQPQSEGLNFMQMFSFMNQINEKSEAKVREATIAQGNNSATMMTALVTLMQSQATQQQNMMMEMSKQSSQMIGEMNKMSLMIFEKLNSKIEGKKENGVDPIALQKLLADARKEAKDEFKTTIELIDKKATEKAEMMMAAQDDDDDDDDEPAKESLTDTVIRSILPVIGQSMAQAAQNRPQATAAPVTQAAVEAAPSKPVTTDRKALPPRTIPAQPKLDSLGFATAPMNVHDGVPKTNIDPTIVKKFDEKAEKIQAIALPIIISDLQTKQSPSLSSIKVISTLISEGYSRQEVVANFHFDEIMKTVESFDIPEDSRKWIRAFADQLQKDLRESNDNLKTVQASKPPITAASFGRNAASPIV